jgi:hypothetical protein
VPRRFWVDPMYSRSSGAGVIRPTQRIENSLPY